MSFVVFRRFCFCSLVVACVVALWRSLSLSLLLLVLCRACVLGRLATLQFQNDALFPKISAICCSVPFVRRRHCSQSSSFSVSNIPGSNHRLLCPSVCHPSLIRSLLGRKLHQHTTVSLVSRMTSFCCIRPLIEINTPLESSWSTRLISIG